MGMFNSANTLGAVLVVVVALAACGAAYAQDAPPAAPTLGKTQICLLSSGHTEEAVCKVTGSGSSRNASCHCPDGGKAIDVSICSTGMKPPKEDSAFRAWRADA